MRKDNAIEELVQLKLALELTEEEQIKLDLIFSENKKEEIKEETEETEENEHLTLTQIKYKRFQEFYKKWITYKDLPEYPKAKDYRNLK